MSETNIETQNEVQRSQRVERKKNERGGERSEDAGKGKEKSRQMVLGSGQRE